MRTPKINAKTVVPINKNEERLRKTRKKGKRSLHNTIRNARMQLQPFKYIYIYIHKLKTKKRLIQRETQYNNSERHLGGVARLRRPKHEGVYYRRPGHTRAPAGAPRRVPRSRDRRALGRDDKPGSVRYCLPLRPGNGTPGECNGILCKPGFLFAVLLPLVFFFRGMLVSDQR